jgi:hypothetical protein
MMDEEMNDDDNESSSNSAFSVDGESNSCQQPNQPLIKSIIECEANSNQD